MDRCKEFRWETVTKVAGRQVETDNRYSSTATLVGKYVFVLGSCGLTWADMLDTEAKAWTRIPRGDPDHLINNHSATLINDKIFVCGVSRPARFRSESDPGVYALDCVTFSWDSVGTSGAGEDADWATLFTLKHTAQYYERTGELVVFGGTSARNTFHNHVRALHVSSGYWTCPPVKGLAPHPKSELASCLVGNVMFVFGGFDGHLRNDLHALALNTQPYTWSRVFPNGFRLPATAFPSLTAVNDRLFVFGGYSRNAATNDLFVVDKCYSEPSCHRVGRSGTRGQFVYTGRVPSARSLPLVLYNGIKLLVLGGGGAHDQSIYHELHPHKQDP